MCPHKPPPFQLSPQPWVTVARLQQRPVGSFEHRPESLAVWATAPPSPNNRVLTTLALLFGPQNAPLPPLWFLFEKMGSWEGAVGGGGKALVGSVVSVWALHKGMEQLYARPCHRHFLGDFRNFDTMKVASNHQFSRQTKPGLVSVTLIGGDLLSTDFPLRKELVVRNAWLLSFISVWEGWLQVPGSLESCWELSHAWCLLDHD